MKTDYDKMEKNALALFLSLAGLIFIFALAYSYSTGHTLAGNLLLLVIVFILLLVVTGKKSSKQQHE